MSKPSWAKAPKWAEWLAQDASGAWVWYAEKPKIMPGDLFWTSHHDAKTAQKAPSDWRRSREKRPAAKESVKRETAATPWWVSSENTRSLKEKVERDIDLHRTPTVVTAVQCPKCKAKIYSRAVHDYHSCPCGHVSVDGGFDYFKVACTTAAEAPSVTEQIPLLTVSKKDLYDDWALEKNKYGVIFAPTPKHLPESSLQACLGCGSATRAKSGVCMYCR